MFFFSCFVSVYNTLLQSLLLSACDLYRTNLARDRSLSLAILAGQLLGKEVLAVEELVVAVQIAVAKR